jgi:glycine dehydrogenase subunit 1
VPAIVDEVAASVPPIVVTPSSPQPLLRTVFELQGMFSALTGLELSAAPFADGPSALAEAIRTAARATGRGGALLARTMNPRYRAIARSLLSPPLTLQEAGYHGGITRPSDVERMLSDGVACVVVEQPNFFGCFEDVAALAEVTHRYDAQLVVKVDPIALGLLAPPGAVGADIAVADAQPLGTRPLYGSESLGLLACRPGLAPALGGWRVERRSDAFAAVGTATDRVRADQVVRPLAYLAAVGAEGLARAATLSMSAAHATQRAITTLEGLTLRFRAPYFKEFAIECNGDPEEVTEALLESNILGALPLQADYPEMENCVLFAATERRSRADIELLRHTLELLRDFSGGDDHDDLSLDADDA